MTAGGNDTQVKKAQNIIQRAAKSTKYYSTSGYWTSYCCFSLRHYLLYS
jgi:hypothetical protein